jgi:DNA-binding NarL/FixJ family response regulator
MAALKAGARGVVLKDAQVERLPEAIRAVHHGTSVLPVGLLRRLSEAGNHPQQLLELPVPLTPRELDVLRLLARGLSNREIAHHLVISEATAMTHVRSILAKLRLSNRTQAALYARNHGLAA